MNFEFSDEQQQLRDAARRFLADHSPTTAVRAVLEGEQAYDPALWKGLGEMGFLGAAIPEEYGGLGLGYLELCVIAEELGRSLAPVPMASSIYLAAELIKAAGSGPQKSAWLPKLASGEAIGCLATSEGPGRVSEKSIQARVTGDKLSGAKVPVLDGMAADFAIVAAKDGDRSISLFIVDLNGPGVSRADVGTIDPARKQASIAFDNAPAERLGAAGEGFSLLTEALDKAAVLTAFEQVGGSDKALEMARDYALQRIAFGRPIGSFQAIKHMLADMYVAATLARSNAYYGAWALSTGAAELPVAAATARVSGTKAFQLCGKNNIQVHGGMGFTWAFDCHLFYRRANLLALTLGSQSEWEDKLIERLRRRNAA